MPTQRLKNVIGGKWQEPIVDEWLPVLDPASEESLAEVPLCGADAVEAAVHAAQTAFEAWSHTPVTKRYRVLFNFQHLLMAHQEELAQLITSENGKSLDDARGEVVRGIECVEYACGIPKLMEGSIVRDIATGMDQELLHYPLGVCAGISPFNFPFMVSLWMVPFAVACGNTFVLKPSERTPLSAMRIAELLTEAGLPDGVLNIVHGAKEVVDGLTTHPLVQSVSFVGSQPVAAHVYELASARHKRVQCGSGAKNHAIVMPDADLEKTIDSILSAAFGNAGQRCMAQSVVISVGEVADTLVTRLVTACDRVRVGNGKEEGVLLGPMISAAARERAERYIELGVQEGAKLLRDGRKDRIRGGKGFFLGPTVLDHATPQMHIVQEEIFAPVLSVMRANNLEEAVDLLNQSRFGNGATIYTFRANSIRYFRDHAQAGMLGVNAGVPTPMAFFPFAGMKDSFYGDLHLTGQEGIAFYTRSKVLTTRT